MNLRIDTAAVRRGGRQIQALTEHLATTLSSAESSVRSAASHVDQPAVRSALEDLLDTLTTTHPRVTTGIDVFAREVELAGEVVEQRDADLADHVPENP